MDTAVVAALIAAGATAIGWAATYLLTNAQNRGNQQLTASLRYVERQLEELYGPLTFLIWEGRRNRKDLLELLGRQHVFIIGEPLPKEELELWLFWAEHVFLPTNEKIKRLLMRKTHLIEGDKMPESYLKFLDHHNSWDILHRRWKEQGVAYQWHSNTSWPYDFADEVVSTFTDLKEQHAQFRRRLSAGRKRTTS